MRHKGTTAHAAGAFALALALVACASRGDLAGTVGSQVARQSLAAVGQGGSTAAELRVYGEACERAGRYQEAAEAYLKAAEIYLRNGDQGAYRYWQRKGSSLASEVRMYVEEPGGRLPEGVYTKARFEPVYGCYLGAFVDDDESLFTAVLLDQRRKMGDKDKFESLIAKKCASYFNYFAFGTPFPTEWVGHLRVRGAAAQLAWEGENHRLERVMDNAYLRDFARRARLSDTPIFLRFAYEMNGDWNHYGTPEEYIRYFRIVHDVMAAEAPNVAMVWSPNCVPESNMDDYYPGDNYVDWVGVSVYATLCRNGDPRQMCDREDITDNLRYIYNLYSARKPIMLSEYGITNQCAATGKDAANWAATRCRYLHSALPRLFPRIKMVSWFSRNNIDLPTDPSRKLNNYSLTAKEPVLRAYRESIASPYFLSRVPLRPWERTPMPGVISPLLQDQTLAGTVKLSAWAKCYDDRPIVKWYVAGQEYARSETIPFEANLDTRQLADGQHEIKIVAYDSQGRTAARQQLTIRVRNAGA